MNDRLEENLLLPIDHPFAMLKESFRKDPAIRSETETALKAVLERLNPSERGTRFLTGGAYEWVLAVACWVAGLKLSQVATLKMELTYSITVRVLKNFGQLRVSLPRN